MSPAIVGPEPPLQAGGTVPPLDPTADQQATSPIPPPLPTSFDISVGVRLANTVRSQTGVSFSESLAAAETTLKFVAQQIPQLADVMEGLVGALEASQVGRVYFCTCMHTCMRTGVYRSCMLGRCTVHAYVA